MARPLLAVARADLDTYAHEQGIGWVDDESNSDPRYARNAVRHQVTPALAQAFPGFQQRFARSAAHAASAQRLLNELAQQDLAAALDGDALSLPVLRGLSVDRQYNLVRFWCGQRGVSLPSTAWLEELVAQVTSAREGAQLLVTHPDCHFRRHRDLLFITPKLADLPGMRDADDIGVLLKEGQSFRWNGEPVLDFPDYGGQLHFEPAAQGFDAGWLRAQLLCIDFRKGGERLKLAPNRPSRSLKAHFQASNIPAWERARLPVVTAKLDLLFAAGLGMDCRHFGTEGELIALRWQSR
jgi:tRNA(Ile)-lysidine synthase